MKISTRGRYSTRMMLELGLKYGKGPALLKEIAESQDISMKYLSQLILPLRVAGLIMGTRGAHGGYLLTKPPEDIKLSEIIIAVEGSLSPVECVDNPDICPRADLCATYEIWKEMGRRNLEFLESYTLKDLVDKHLKKQKKVS
ncbi:MAG: Rrf2 family transcriptional regulator [Actinobacteria bacterium]|nr:Rrf2 family transcriptional regulator [Actinomycetota bacterium]